MIASLWRSAGYFVLTEGNVVNQGSATISKSGVRIASDFRENLIIDRYDPLFQRMRASKRTHMRSENSEDAVTWNVFRSLRQIDPTAWLPTLSKIGLNLEHPLSEQGLAVLVWKTATPPPSLVVELDEGDSEIDVVLKAPSWVWFIEAKYKSDIAQGTSNRPLRDQVLRNIDVGSWYAGVRDFYFSLLVSSPTKSPKGCEAIERYKNLSEPRRLLREHRSDSLANLKAITLLTWSDLSTVLTAARQCASREEERGYADRTIRWLSQRGLAETVGEGS